VVRTSGVSPNGQPNNEGCPRRGTDENPSRISGSANDTGAVTGEIAGLSPRRLAASILTRARQRRAREVGRRLARRQFRTVADVLEAVRVELGGGR